MKKALLFTFAIFFSGILFAQIPNSDFEFWSSGSPLGWSISNGVPNGVTQSFNAYSGNYAVKLAVGNFMGTNFGGYIISGTGSQPFFGITTTPVALTGWYI